MKKAGWKKWIAPVLITAIVILGLILYFSVFLYLPIPMWCKVLAGIALLALAGAMVYVLIERIQEIRSGEEDDLSQY